ncbi:phage major tail tube protein [Gorillibacterium sp. sgz5001074]|uniref:phage major tail tube protein n=1 Tax=Gorillibacterium sp. sgz5001074 TaxID=3446695 RepID=UPI003F6820DA
MKITNKTIQYKLKATDLNGILQIVDDVTDLQLPSIEKLTDTTKGAGIMGEVDMPSYGQIGSMTFTVNHRADNPVYAVLSRPGEIRFEVIWVTDIFDTSGNRISVQQNKVFMTGFNKKYDPGKLEVNGSADGSSEYEIVNYRKVVDGVEVLLIDKFNYRYVVNGVDLYEQLRTALQ